MLGAMCGQVGSLMAAEAVKLVAGIGEPLLGRVAVLDVLSARWSEIPLQARTNQPQPASVAPQAPAPVPTITARELATRLTTRDAQQDSFVLLDVRESGERDIAVIPGAIHIPLGQVLADPTTIVQRLRAAATVGNGGDPIGGDPVRGSSKRNSLPLDVVVHCLSGPRSDRAAAALLAAGVHAVNLEGGIRAWATDVDPSLATY